MFITPPATPPPSHASPRVCSGHLRTLDKAINYKVIYDVQMQQTSMAWMSDTLTRNHYKGPFTPAYCEAMENDDFLDYATDIDEDEERDEDLPMGISFAEDLSNNLAAMRGSCENDSLLVLWRKDSIHNSVKYLTSIRFPSGNLLLKQNRDNIWVWQQDQSPSLKSKVAYNLQSGWDYAPENEQFLELRGFSYWNYKYGYYFYGTDKLLSFFTYLCVRTAWDWDRSLINSNPYYGVYPRKTADRSSWPRLAKRLFQLKENSAEIVLIQIVDTYWSYFDQLNTQWYTNQYVVNYDVVEYWLDNNLIPYVNYNNDYKSFLVGSEYQNVIAPLKESCIIKELTICFCDNDPNNVVTSVTSMNTRTFSSIIDFNKFKTVAASEHIYAFNTAGMCLTCFDSKRYVQYFVGDTTWFLYLEPKLHEFVSDLDPNALPKELKIRDAFSASDFATFDLGYVSFVKFTNAGQIGDEHGMTHYVSFQFLWGIWYYYDSKLRGGYLLLDNDPMTTVKTNKLIFAAAVYFRR